MVLLQRPRRDFKTSMMIPEVRMPATEWGHRSSLLEPNCLAPHGDAIVIRTLEFEDHECRSFHRRCTNTHRVVRGITLEDVSNFSSRALWVCLVVLAGARPPVPARINMLLASRVVEAQEAAGNNGDDVFSVSDARVVAEICMASLVPCDARLRKEC